MIIVWNKSLNKLDLHSISIYFHLKHLVSVSERLILLHFNIIIVFYLELLHNYPSSVVTLSLLCNNITSNTFIFEQIKSFILLKKDSTHYLVSQHLSLLFHFISSLLFYIYRHNSHIVHLNFKVLLHNHDLISPNSDQSWTN